MTLHAFDRFPDLPREIQLQIWAIHEADNFPHFRHYFRRMVYYEGRLYTAADLKTGQQVESWSWSQFTFPYIKAHLPGGQHWFSVLPQPSAHNFTSIQSPMPSDATRKHICVNFKHDDFCFALGNGAHDALDHLDYFTGVTSSSGPINLDPTHWFFSIQHLGLITSPGRSLTDCDRRLLSDHPSLKTVAIIVTPDAIRCGHPRCGPGHRLPEGGNLERMPLDEFVQMLMKLHPCGCGARQRHVQALQLLRQELVDLFGQHRGQNRVRTRPPTARVEVEMTALELAAFLHYISRQEDAEREKKRLDDLRAARAETGEEDNAPQPSLMQVTEYDFDEW